MSPGAQRLAFEAKYEYIVHWQFTDGWDSRALATANDYQDRSAVWFKVQATVIQRLLGNCFRLRVKTFGKENDLCVRGHE